MAPRAKLAGHEGSDQGGRLKDPQVVMPYLHVVVHFAHDLQSQPPKKRGAEDSVARERMLAGGANKRWRARQGKVTRQGKVPSCNLGHQNGIIP